MVLFLLCSFCSFWVRLFFKGFFFMFRVVEVFWRGFGGGGRDLVYKEVEVFRRFFEVLVKS